MQDILKNEVYICTKILEEEEVVYQSFLSSTTLSFLSLHTSFFLCFQKYSWRVVGYSSVLLPMQKYSLEMEA